MNSEPPIDHEPAIEPETQLDVELPEGFRIRRKRSLNSRGRRRTSGPPSRRQEVIRRAVMVLVVIGALVGLYLTGRAANIGLGSTSGSLPEQVDRLIPASGAEVLRQSQLGIDVADGYDAYLIVNGVEIRSADDGLIKDLGTGLVLLQPGPGKAIETLNEGRNCVVAMVWDKLKSPTTASPVSWCFNAT